MSTCAVPNCPNFYGKGFTLHKFPRNEKKRKLWTKMINRPNWEPSESSVLCEVHFKDDAWETIRVGGKKKLKMSATPTLFFHTPLKTPKTTKSTENILKTSTSTNRRVVLVDTLNKNEIEIQLPTSKISPREDVLITSVEDSDEIPLFDPNSQEIPLFDPEPEEIIFDADSEEIPLFDPDDYAMAFIDKKEDYLDSDNFEEVPEDNEEVKVYEKTFSQSEQNIDQEREDLQSKIRLEHYEKILKNPEKDRINLQQQVTSLKRKLKRLEEIRDESKILLRLKTIFNEDQLLTLIRGKESRLVWSDETLEKALKLRLTCGEAGYTELLRQNMPLPCSRSLRRAVKLSRFTKRFSEEVVQYVKNEFGSNVDADGLSPLKKKKRGRKSCFDEIMDS